MKRYDSLNAVNERMLRMLQACGLVFGLLFFLPCNLYGSGGEGFIWNDNSFSLRTKIEFADAAVASTTKKSSVIMEVRRVRYVMEDGRNREVMGRVLRDTIEEVIEGMDVMDEIAESGEENVDGAMEDLAVHLAYYKRHPLNINSATRRELERSGLFTEFQIESLLKYIGRTGAVLSFAELSLLYGFNEDLVKRIAPYIVLGEKKRVSRGFRYDVSSDIYARYTGTLEQQSVTRKQLQQTKVYEEALNSHSTASSFGLSKETYLARMKAYYADRVEVAALWSGSAIASTSGKSGVRRVSAERFISGGVSVKDLSIGRLKIDRVVVGDFAAKFGQGLSVWNGFTYSGVDENYGFSKRGEAISLYNSSDTTKTLRGGSLSLSMGKVSYSGGYAVEKKLLLNRLSYNGSLFKIALNHSQRENAPPILSMDVKTGIGVTRLFGEGAWNYTTNATAFLLGCSTEYGKWSMHLLTLIYSNSFISSLSGAYSSLSHPANQRGFAAVTAGPLYKKLKFSASFQYMQYPKERYHLNYPSAMYKGYVKLSVDDAGFTTPARNELYFRFYTRCNITYKDPAERVALYSLRLAGKKSLGSNLTLGVRGEWNNYNCYGVMAYLRSLFLKSKVSAVAGAVSYDVKKWDGRIYFPESELPMTFSSHLLYGTGVDWFAMVSAKFTRWLSLHFKVQQRAEKLTLKGALRLLL